jgi:hypothetical protein
LCLIQQHRDDGQHNHDAIVQQILETLDIT